jgi:hypothetical protein
MFSVPKFQFPGNIHNTADSGEAFQSGLLQSGDTITDKIDIWGTRYKNGHLVIIEVICKDILVMGVVEKIIVRASKVLFLVSLHDCARDSFNIFQSVPKNKVKLVSYSGLADFKPLIKRGQGDSFSFVLHHYVPVMM